MRTASNKPPDAELRGRIVVGCCGWAEAQARYTKTFPTIELQTTFYQPPADKVAERWKSHATPDFRFCMKAWQLITHTPSSPTYRRLKSEISAQERELYGSFRPTEQVRLAWERTREIADIISRGRNGVMPAWRDRLSVEDASFVAAWVYAQSHPPTIGAR